MLTTKNLITTDVQIPSSWVFEYYLTIPEKLTGQDVKIVSIFNPSERTPSMCIFLDRKAGEYKYKDFSTGNYGSKIDIVKELFQLNYSQAVFKIITDFNNYVISNGTCDIGELKEHSKWHVGFCGSRPWNRSDKDFWLRYGIGTSLLHEYNVRPLEYYRMTRETAGKMETIDIEHALIYAFYDKNQLVYKIYQPRNKKYKFIKRFHHIQGIDQLKYEQPYLVICSSLKDAMSLRHFNYNLEVIAPDSENTMIKPYVIENLKQKYKKVITLFDNDAAGMNAIKKYQEVYDIPGIYLNMSKDISDAVKEFGSEKVHEELKDLLRKALKE